MLVALWWDGVRIEGLLLLLIVVASWMLIARVHRRELEVAGQSLRCGGWPVGLVVIYRALMERVDLIGVSRMRS